MFNAIKILHCLRQYKIINSTLNYKFVSIKTLTKNNSMYLNYIQVLKNIIHNKPFITFPRLLISFLNGNQTLFSFETGSISGKINSLCFLLTQIHLLPKIQSRAPK